MCSRRPRKGKVANARLAAKFCVFINLSGIYLLARTILEMSTAQTVFHILVTKKEGNVTHHFVGGLQINS